MQSGKHGSQIVISSIEAMIHLGRSYIHTHRAAVASDGTLDILVVPTGNTKKVHIAAEITGTGSASIDVYGNPDVSSNGTLVNEAPTNLTDQRPKAANVYHGPSLNNTGTLFTEELVPGGLLDQPIGWKGSGFIMGSGDTILIRLTNNDNSEQTFGIRIITDDENE